MCDDTPSQSPAWGASSGVFGLHSYRAVDAAASEPLRPPASPARIAPTPTSRTLHGAGLRLGVCWRPVPEP
eukprot:6900774-Prymnesium_polylepis.1